MNSIKTDNEKNFSKKIIIYYLYNKSVSATRGGAYCDFPQGLTVFPTRIMVEFYKNNSEK